MFMRALSSMQTVVSIFSHILFCNAFVILLNQKVVSSSASVADVDLEVLRQRG